MQTTKKDTIRAFSIISLIILFLFVIFFISNYISKNTLTPQDSEASADLSSLYSPLLDNSAGRITQPYNINSGGSHWGIDIGWNSSQANPKDIYAAGSGVVTDDSSSRRYCQSECGNYVTIKHNSNLYTRYQHLAAEYVSVGQTVDQNTKIGLMGSTGNSTGVHLHFEITTKEMVFNPTDQSQFLNPTNVYLRKRDTNPGHTDTPQEEISCGSFGCKVDADCAGFDNNKPGTTTCNERADGDASKQKCSRICTYGYVDGNICSCATAPTDSVECKKMDINGDSILNYIDLQSFGLIYNKSCSNDSSNIDSNGCKGQDFNNDKLIDYKDLAKLVSNYFPRVQSCVGMQGL